MSKQRYTPTEEEQNALAREIAKEPITEDYSQSPTMDNRYEARTLRCIVGKAGGNAGTNSLNYKISIPSAWAAALGVSLEDREVKVTFDGEKIIIEKP